MNAAGQFVEPVSQWACVETTVNMPDGRIINVSDFYYFNEKSEMVTGWLSDATGKTYYLETTNLSDMGKMARGWKEIAGNYYYFNSDGTLLRSGVTPDGFMVDADGAWAS